MEYELYVIYDTSLRRYGVPMAQENDAVAMRSFAHECMNESSIWNSHPDQFILYKIGVYNCDTGEILPCAPERIASASDFVRR